MAAGAYDDLPLSHLSRQVGLRGLQTTRKKHSSPTLRMPCYYPIPAWKLHSGQITFYDPGPAWEPSAGAKPIHVPCGQCAGCRRRRSLEWATRCMHEKQLHAHNCFITLTYDDNYLPEYGKLVHRHWQLFAKRLRNSLSREKAHYLVSMPSGGETQHEHTNLRFYMAGEYGEKYGRPHFHALLFGVDFRDKLLHGRTSSGEHIYTSPKLQQLWPYGFSSIGQITFNSAAYVSRYIMKKRTGDGNKTNYEILNLDTGEIIDKRKEYNCMSRRPGIAHNWWQKYKADVYTTDKVVTRTGRILRPPRYYDKLLRRHDAALLQGIKHARELQAIAQAHNHTTERLAAAAIIQDRLEELAKVRRTLS